MKSLLATSAIVIFGALSVSQADAQTAPSGAAGTDCNINQFVPVISDRTGEILYWNNRTCPAASGATTTFADDGGEVKEKGKRRGRGWRSRHRDWERDEEPENGGTTGRDGRGRDCDAMPDQSNARGCR